MEGLAGRLLIGWLMDFTFPADDRQHGLRQNHKGLMEV